MLIFPDFGEDRMTEERFVELLVKLLLPLGVLLLYAIAVTDLLLVWLRRIAVGRS